MVNAGGQTIHNSFTLMCDLIVYGRVRLFSFFSSLYFSHKRSSFVGLIYGVLMLEKAEDFLFYWQLSGHTSHTLGLSNWSFKSLQMVEIQLKLGYSIWFLIVICSFLPVSRMAACLYLVSVGSLWLLGWKLLARGGIKSRISGDCLCGQNCMPQMWVNWNVP